MARHQVSAGPLWQNSILTGQEAEEAVTALMERVFGQSPSTYTSAEGKESEITIYHSEPLDATRRRELRDGLQKIETCGLSVEPGTVLSRKVRREDWSQSWKKNFRSITIGSAVLIRPSWSRRRPRRGQIVVVLDPGLSFGTGQHPTTAFCLTQLVTAQRPGEPQAFCDIGTGSGILAITAAKLGYAPVRAFDFDPVAVRFAKANARRNRVETRVLITRKDLSRLPLESRTQYDLICANLTDDLLIAQSDKILHRLKPTGRLVLAGMLTTQFGGVRKAFEDRGLKLLCDRTEGEWHSAALVPGTFRRLA